jgi:uncharacterized protein (UPF0335 family)
MSDEPTADPSDELGGNSRKELENFISQIETLSEEKKAIGEDIKAKYSDAAASGFDKVAIRQIIKERAADTDKTVKHRRLVELYRRALAKSAQATFGDWARGWIARDAKESLQASKDGHVDPKFDEFLKRRKNAGDADKTGEAHG